MPEPTAKATLATFTAADHSERFQLLYTYTPTELSDLILFANVAATRRGAPWNTRTARQDLERHRKARQNIHRTNSQNRKTA